MMMIAIVIRAIPMIDIKIAISPSGVQSNHHYIRQVTGADYPHVPIAYL